MARARKIQRFLSQPFFVGEVFTGLKGIYVPVEETVESFEALVNGELDDVPEQAFFNVGGVESVLAKAKTLQERLSRMPMPLHVQVVSPEQVLFEGEAEMVVCRADRRRRSRSCPATRRSSARSARAGARDPHRRRRAGGRGARRLRRGERRPRDRALRRRRAARADRRARAEAAKERAEAALAREPEDEEAKAALARAETRLEVASS